jgi:(p)ppGpp synthase/HD superfamily hydrolase
MSKFCSAEIDRAIKFAKEAHTGQKRKYSDEDYVEHPIRVAKKIAWIDNSTEDMVIAAILHDTVEDTDVSLQEINDLFGTKVADMVNGLTQADKISPEIGKLSRVERMKANLEKLKKEPWEVKLIKLADRLDNLGVGKLIHLDAIGFFRRKYLKESKDLLEVLRGTDAKLEEKLENRINELADQLGVKL